MTQPAIRVAAAQLVGNELAYVTDVVRSGWLSSGPYVERLERAFAEAAGAPRALACANGTVALHLALLAAGVGPGDEVVVPALTYVATANAVRYCGAVPVFADVHPQHWCLDTEAARAAITPRTRALLPVHLYGATPDMDALLDLAADHGLAVVEDAAEALGTRWRGRHAGTMGDAGTFSFFGNKTLTCGEGGMVLLRDAAAHALARRLSRQGVAEPAPGQHWYSHDLLGFNYRMTDLQAAVALAQVECRAWHLRARDVVAEYYGSRPPVPGCEAHRTHRHTTRTPWMVAVLLPAGCARDAVMAAMAADGVETRPVFLPVTALPVHATGERFPVAEEISTRGLCLPTHAGLTASDLARVWASLGSAVARCVGTEVR